MKLLNNGIIMDSKKKFTEEFRGEAIKLVTEQGYSQSEAGKKPWSIIECAMKNEIKLSEDIITPLLQSEEKFYQEISCQITDTKLEKFRCNLSVLNEFRQKLRRTLTAIHETSVIIEKHSQLRMASIAALKYLTRYSYSEGNEKNYHYYKRSEFPFSLENLLLIYQFAHEIHADQPPLLCKFELIEFFKQILELSNSHFGVTYTYREFAVLEKLKKVVLRYPSDSTLSLSIRLFDYLCPLANRYYSNTPFSVFILKNEDDYTIYIDNNFVFISRYLFDLKNKISNLSNFDDEKSKQDDLTPHEIYPILTETLPDEVLQLVMHYYSSQKLIAAHFFKNIDDLISNITGLSNLNRDSDLLFLLYRYRIILWAIKYNLPISLLPEEYQNSEQNINLKGFPNDPIQAMTQLMVKSGGLLEYFSKNVEKTERYYLKISNLIGNTLDLIQTHTSIELNPNSYFYDNIDKYFGFQLSQLSSPTAYSNYDLIRNDQQFFKTLNKQLPSELKMSKPHDLLVRYKNTVKLFIMSKSRLTLWLLSLTPSSQDVNFILIPPQRARIKKSFKNIKRKYLVREKHLMLIGNVISHLNGYDSSHLLYSDIKLKIFQNLIIESIKDAEEYVFNKNSALDFLQRLNNKISDIQEIHKEKFKPGLLGGAKAGSLLQQTLDESTRVSMTLR